MNKFTKEKIEETEKYHIKIISDNFNCDITTDEINDIYDSLFNEANGILYHLTASKIQELSFSKDNQILKDDDLDVGNF